MSPLDDANDAGAIFQDYHDRIRRYLLGMVQDSAEAEDLTQETFLRAYARRESLRDPNAVRGWLYRIATHVAFDRLRQRVPQVPLDDADRARRLPAAPPGPPSALEISERGETSACVQRCLDFLSDRYRAVILLHEAHSLTAVEIAELLGESPGAIKIRLRRARRKLEEIMRIGCTVSEAKTGVPCCEPKL